MFSDLPRFITEPCIEIRLAAARLVGRELHIHLKALKDIHDRLARLRVERIDQAGNEKLDGSHTAIVPLVSSVALI
jgi:hypothetical protein